jgi:hypothetical protein
LVLGTVANSHQDSPAEPAEKLGRRENARVVNKPFLRHFLNFYYLGFHSIIFILCDNSSVKCLNGVKNKLGKINKFSLFSAQLVHISKKIVFQKLTTFQIF